MTAASVGTLAEMKLLVAYGASLETLGPRIFQSILPRVNTVYRGETLSILEYLLDHGVDINRQEPRGTALHTAVDVGDPVLMRWLLDHGADREIRTADGLTAPDWAKEMEELEMLKLLQDYK
jgi:ankyrin repeat protein